MSAEQSSPRRRKGRGPILMSVAAVVIVLPVVAVGLLSAEPKGTMFTDVAGPLVEPTARSEGACWADLDGDGHQDLIVAVRDGPVRLWRNNGDRTFTDIGGRAGIAARIRRASGCAAADFDNDGDVDVFFTARSRAAGNPSSNKLFRNNGDGTFTDMEASAGVFMHQVGAAASDWADFDGDGYLDAFVAARRGGSSRTNALFRQRSPLVFVDQAQERGVADPPGPQYAFLGSWFDYDADGDVDLLIAVDFWGVELYRNDGGRFVNVTRQVLPPAMDKTPAAPPNNPMGVTWGDYDSDGCMDGFITGTNVPGQGGFEGETLGDLASRLYRNNCDGTFTDVTKAVGLRPTGAVEWSANFVDFDNDRDLDLSVVAGNSGDKVDENSPLTRRVVNLIVGSIRRFIPPRMAARLYRFEAMIPASGGTGYAAAMPNFLYRNLLVETGTARFVDVTYQVGTGDMGSTQGSAWADFDNDGDLDWFVPNRETPNRLFLNNGPVGTYLRVHLQGRRIRDAIGAWVKIKVGTGWQIRHVHVLDGYLSQSQMDPHFGLGQARQIDELWVRWPGSREWTLMCRGIQANRKVTVTERGGCR